MYVRMYVCACMLVGVYLARVCECVDVQACMYARMSVYVCACLCVSVHT